MSSDQFPHHNSGIYRNLPTFDPSIKGLTALVAGASGISGWNTIVALLESPERWSKIYAVSRTPLPRGMLGLLREDQQARLQHVVADLLESPADIAQRLKLAGIAVSHVFFYAYIQPKAHPGQAAWSNNDEIYKVNERLFSNFIQSLPLADIVPQRILLQTGFKNYGVHLGRARSPAIESDPQPRHLAPNFYYAQEDLLLDYCRRHPGTSWNVIRPGPIIGTTMAAAIHHMYGWSVYAAVQAQRNEPLYFHGDWTCWQNDFIFSSARLTGYLSEWAVLEDKCKNQAFNSQNDSPISQDRFFHELARWFGVEKGVVGPAEDESGLRQLTLPGGKSSPMGYGPPVRMGTKFSYKDWACDPASRQAWEEILQRSNNAVVGHPLEQEDNFSVLDAFNYRQPSATMGKAKRFGWTGFVDSLENAFEVAAELAELKMIPPVKVDFARPLM